MRDLAQYEDAISAYEKAMEARAELEGKESMNYALTLSMCAGAFRELQKYDKAYEMLKEAYTTMATINRGEENLACAVVLNSMGLLFKRQKKWERAEDCYERCHKVRLEFLGTAHPDTISIRHNLGEMYIEMGNN